MNPDADILASVVTNRQRFFYLLHQLQFCVCEPCEKVCCGATEGHFNDEFIFTLYVNYLLFSKVAQGFNMFNYGTVAFYCYAIGQMCIMYYLELPMN